MTTLHVELVTPLSGSLARFGQAAATGLTLWAKYAADLPSPWTEVELEIRDTIPDPKAAMGSAIDMHPDVLFGPYGSSNMLAAGRATERVVWYHGGATSQLTRLAFPHVVNVLSPATTYFEGVLQAVRATHAKVSTISLYYASSGFGRDVASGAVSAANKLNFEIRTVPFEPNHAVENVSSLPSADILLVVGNFADELAIAPILLTRTWHAAAFVGAGVEEVLAPLGNLREGLLGPAQWIATSALKPDEGPDSDWFVTKYQQMVGCDPPYPAAQAFAAGILYARCLRDSGVNEEAAQLATAYQLTCNTLYGRFRIDTVSGLQIGHQVLIVQWQNGIRRVVWPPEQAERPLLYPLMK